MPPALLSALFNVPSLDGVDMSTLAVDPHASDVGARLSAVIGALREDRARCVGVGYVGIWAWPTGEREGGKREGTVGNAFFLSTLPPSTASLTTHTLSPPPRLFLCVFVCACCACRYMHLHFIREGDGYAEAYFARYLVEDRANFPGGALSYTEYFSLVNKQQ